MKSSVYSARAPQPQSHRKKIIALIVVFGLGLVVATAWILFFRPKAAAPSVTPAAETPAIQSGEAPKSVQGKYLFSGTIVMARAVEKYSGGNYAQPFSQFNSFKPDQYDGWLADWECPTDGDTVIPYQQQIANLQFNCRPEWLPQISKYFNVMNLANNHSGDMGEATFIKTQNYLTKAGIQTVGNYDPAVKKDICEVIALPVRVKMPDDSSKKGTLPVAYCAWHYFFRLPRAGEIETMKPYAEKMPVFGLMHVGVEYQAKADPNQQAVARKIIDNGADFVVGNSPHWVQNSEVYKGKLIAYSTGNFIFDQLESETNRGASIEVSATVNYDENVAKWLELGEQCKKQYDDCLQKAVDQNLQKIDMKLTYDVVANTSGVRTVTKKAPANIQAAVEQRMNWASVKKELGQ